ncbi:hypothetical protein N9P64_00805 [bacterium]|nr:hypothetical protein [bacterium]
MEKCFCFIPAKSNSERLKNKNNLLLNGQPLYYYPIKCAVKSKLFDSEDIIFSSDSEQMNRNAAAYGANVPYVRPENLTENNIGIVHVLLDFLEQRPKYKEYEYAFISLPTAPLTRPLDYIKSLNTIKREKSNTLLSISKNSNSIFQSMSIEKGLLKPVFEKSFLSKKVNSAYDTYHPNGCVHIIRIDKLISEGSYVINPISAYEMESNYGVDIDTESDFNYAQYLIKNNLIDFSWI